MNNQYLMIAAVAIVALMYFRNSTSLSNVSEMLATNRNLVIAGMLAVVGYYLMNVNKPAAPPVEGDEDEDEDEALVEEAFGCGKDHYPLTEGFGSCKGREETFQEDASVPKVSGNYLDGTSKHTQLFDQQVQPALPYVLGTTLPPPQPEIVKRGFMSSDLRPRPAVNIDPTDSFPFGMSSVAVNLTQAGATGIMPHKDIGVGKCL